MIPAVGLIGSVLRAGLDLVLPPRCPGCGQVVDGDHRFCVACWRRIDFLGPPACPRCAIPLPHALGQGESCEACAAAPPGFDRAAAAVAYGEIARAMALRLKYGRRPAIARTMAHHMARLLDDAPAGAILAPVPLHRGRLWSRGYNQALLIARGLARRTGRACVPDLIERRRATPPLRGMGGAERARAVAGAFAVPAPEAAADRAVLLVDDVHTSGATASACAQALKRAGAGEVWLLCWARVVRDDPAGR